MRNSRGQSTTEYAVITGVMLIIIGTLFSEKLPFNFPKKLKTFEKSLLSNINSPVP
jgi:hypothetical protein